MSPATPMKSRERFPSIFREVEEMLAAIPYDTKEEREKAVSLTMEHLVPAMEAVNDFKTVLARGMEDGDPVMLLAAVQAYRDRIAAWIGRNDENLGKVLEANGDANVRRAASRLTDGEFHRASDAVTFVREAAYKRALTDILREKAGPVLAAARDRRVEQKLRDEADVSNGPAGPGPHR